MTPASDALERFCRQVIATPALLDRLCAETDSFVPLLIELGREHGADFTADDVAAALQARRADWLKHSLL